MSNQDHIEFGNLHNAMKVFYGSINLQRQNSSRPSLPAAPATAKISLTPRTSHNRVNTSTSTVTQISILESFMESQPKKIKRKKQEGLNKSLLDEFLLPKGEIVQQNKTRSTTSKNNQCSHLQESVAVAPFVVTKKTPKKFVDLNLFKKKRKADVQSNYKHVNQDEDDKQNRPNSTNIQLRFENSKKHSHKLQIQDILSQTKNLLYEQQEEKKRHQSYTDIMNSQYFNLCQTYNSSQPNKSQLSAVIEEDVQQSLAQSLIKQSSFNLNDNHNMVLMNNNISQIFQRNNLSFEEQQQFIDLQKFIVGDLKVDIESLCYKLNESGVFHPQLEENASAVFQQQSQILSDVKVRLETLKRRIVTDCPFLQL